ncbi:MAG: hypothetical protein R3279_06480 [Putridiphycobacter sp.]|nr:hypothetical protein [Putridiphycobacter sp.]
MTHNQIAAKIIDEVAAAGLIIDEKPAQTYRMMERVILDAITNNTLIPAANVVDEMVQYGLNTDATGHRIIENAIKENA